MSVLNPFRKIRHRLTMLGAATVAAMLVACGGGSDGADAGPAAPPVEAPPGAPQPEPEPQPPEEQPSPPPQPLPPGEEPEPLPPLAAPVDLIDGGTLGTPRWPAGNTVAGGQGQAVEGINCGLMSTAYHVHAHVGIYLDGEMLQIPPNTGIVPATATSNRCTYALHTHDGIGKIHIEGPEPTRFTLGQWFAIWGQPLSASQVADLGGAPIVFYINDGGVLTRYDGDPREIELIGNREITIQVGSALPEIATYNWAED